MYHNMFFLLKVGGQVVEYYKQAIKSIEHSNTKEHGDRIIDFIGNKQQNQWAALIKFKVMCLHDF